MNREQDVELLFAHNPRAGVRFLRPLLIAGTMTSSLLSALDLHIFSLRMPVGWHAMPSCGIAGTWILLQVALQIAQLPVRVLLMRRLNAAAAAGSDDVAALHLLALNRSIAWKTNKRLGAINLAWFVVGVIVSCANGGGPCQMRWLILFHIGCALARSRARLRLPIVGPARRRALFPDTWPAPCALVFQPLRRPLLRHRRLVRQELQR